MDTSSLMGNSERPELYYACRHVRSSTSALRHGQATKENPDLCPSCKLSLLEQRLDYFRRSKKTIGDFESRQLLLQVLEAKLYVSPGTFLDIVNDWSAGAARRLDGHKKASLEVSQILSILDHVENGPFLMELVQVARQQDRIRRVKEEQKSIFQVEWSNLKAAHEYYLMGLNDGMDPVLACKQFSKAVDSGAPPEDKQSHEEIQPSSDDALACLIRTRQWNPQVVELGSRLQEALKQGSLKARLDEEMTNAEEIIATLLAVQRSIAIGDIKAKPHLGRIIPPSSEMEGTET